MKSISMLTKNRYRSLKNGLRRCGFATQPGDIQKNVIISESNDIFTNLALEDWLYKNGDFGNKQTLMLWTNNPCVVIGKFQNPWLEANVAELGAMIPEGVKLARRNSGGGTVYHDRGNLNLTFFTAREHYKRIHNLEVITRAILKEYGLVVDISPREDLLIGDCKVSGTAAKLSRLLAYHHCTLLVNANKTNLRIALKKPTYDIETNATRSVPSKIKNLCDVESTIKVEHLMVCIGQEYLRTVNMYNISKETISSTNKDLNLSHDTITKFRILTPTEDEFPGLTDIRESLASWDWTFGKCPKFIAHKTYPCLRTNLENTTNLDAKTRISLTVEGGLIKDVGLQSSEVVNLQLDDFTDRAFNEKIFDEVYESLVAQNRSDDELRNVF